MVLADRLREVRQRFFAILDSEAVAPLQAVFYASFILGAAYLLFCTTTPIESIEKALGTLISNIWATTLIGGPAVWMGGRRMRNDFAYVGLWLQFVGDFITGGALTVYTWAVVADKDWGEAIFAPFISVPTILCIGLLTVRDVRRIVQVEQQVHVDKREAR